MKAVHSFPALPLSDVCHLHESSACIQNIKKKKEKTCFSPTKKKKKKKFENLLQSHNWVNATDWEQICGRSKLHVADTHLQPPSALLFSKCKCSASQIKVKALRGSEWGVKMVFWFSTSLAGVSQPLIFFSVFLFLVFGSTPSCPVLYLRCFAPIERFTRGELWAWGIVCLLLDINTSTLFLTVTLTSHFLASKHISEQWLHLKNDHKTTTFEIKPF